MCMCVCIYIYIHTHIRTHACKVLRQKRDLVLNIHI